VAREAELHRREAALRRQAGETAGVPVRPADELALRRLQEHERALTERESRLAKVEELADASRARLVEKEERVDARSEELKLRQLQLDEREGELHRQEARLLADHEVREHRLDERETERVDKEERLTERESQLSTYVAELQGQLTADEEWWAKQLGTNREASAA